MKKLLIKVQPSAEALQALNGSTSLRRLEIQGLYINPRQAVQQANQAAAKSPRKLKAPPSKGVKP